MSRMLTIGVLSLQGSVAEHMETLQKLGTVNAVEVKTVEGIRSVDGLILPGGESTTTGKLLKIFGLEAPLKERILGGMPVWGICAGMILLAKRIEGENPHLGVMDITVRRNVYGRQAESFTARCRVPEFGEQEIPLVFIRAPWVESAGEGVKVLLELDGHIAAVREGAMLATSFHPELTEDLTVHRYFTEMVRKARQ